MSEDLKRVSFVGIGYVGLASAVCFADKGYQVTCIDIDKKKINSLKNNIIPFYEPNLNNLLKKNQHLGRISFVERYHEGLKGCKICFVCVGTPSRRDGRANTYFLKKALSNIVKNLSGHSIIVIKSTVPVGTARCMKSSIELMSKNSTVSSSFDIVSNPEFLREGSAINDFLSPDRVIIGGDRAYAVSFVKGLYLSLGIKKEKILTMSHESAELAKYASNAMLATRISFMNELAIIAEKVGANITNVRDAMGCDSRIGRYFLEAGIGYGGSCFPKDISELIALSKAIKVKASILEAVDLINKKQVKFFVNKINEYFSSQGGLTKKCIAIWGVSFKPNTDDIREAPALLIIEALKNIGAVLFVFDPVALPKTKKLIGENKKLIYCSDEYQAAYNADAIVLLTDWNRFKYIDMQNVLSKMKGKAFFDGRNQFNPKKMSKYGFDYFGIGT